MSESRDRLRIHAQITPPHSTEDKPVRWQCLPYKEKKKLSYTDRLLRNSAFACAMLLGILTLGNIDHPAARNASESVRQALSMHIDLDESIGRLSFVRKLMPETALVFFNLTSEYDFTKPSTGQLIHPFSDIQPWLLFSTAEENSVYAASNGIVTAISELSDGSTGILIDHGNGVESVYAYLTSVSVKVGENVVRSQIIGQSDNMLYYELRSGETSINPGERMGL